MPPSIFPSQSWKHLASPEEEFQRKRAAGISEIEEAETQEAVGAEGQGWVCHMLDFASAGIWFCSCSPNSQLVCMQHVFHWHRPNAVPLIFSILHRSHTQVQSCGVIRVLFDGAALPHNTAAAMFPSPTAPQTTHCGMRKRLQCCSSVELKLSPSDHTMWQAQEVQRSQHTHPLNGF